MTETAPAPRKFKAKKAITLSTLKFVVDKPLHVLILGKLHEGKARVGRSGNVKLDSDGQPRRPPTLVEVLDMDTGEMAQIIAATIIKTELSEAYPNDGYVGLGFEITKQKRKEGREYDPYSIVEVEVPEEFVAVANKARDDKPAPPSEDSTVKAPANTPATLQSRRR